MHNFLSDQKNHQKSRTPRWLSLLLICCLLAMGALAAYSWHLNRQLTELTPPPAGSERLAALIDQSTPQAEPVTTFPASRGLPLRHPFDPFSDPFFTSGLIDSIQLRSLFGSSFTPMQARMAGPELALSDEGDAFKVSILVGDGTQVELNTDIVDNVLSISGKLRRELETARGNLVSSSSSVTGFSRSIRLPVQVDAAGIRTEQQDDQIVITIPKSRGQPA